MRIGVVGVNSMTPFSSNAPYGLRLDHELRRQLLERAE